MVRVRPRPARVDGVVTGLPPARWSTPPVYTGAAVPAVGQAWGEDAPGLAGLERAAARIGEPLLGVAVVGGRLGIVWANPAAQDLFGRDADELSTADVVDLLGVSADLFGGAPPPSVPGRVPGARRAPSPDQVDQVDQVDQADQVGVWWETLLLGPDGVHRPGQVRITPVPDGSDGAVGGVRPAGESGVWAVAVRVVTDAEAAIAQARAEAEHGIRAVAEHAPIGIILSEAGIRLGFVNSAFAALLDRPAPVLLGQGWLTGIHRDDQTALHAAVAQVLTGEGAEVTVRVAATDRPAGRDRAGGRGQHGRTGRPDTGPASGGDGGDGGNGGDGAVGAGGGVGSRWVTFRLVPVTTPRRAAGFVATVEDVTDRRAREAVLTFQAYHDPLTGLANRRRLLDTLTDLLDSHRGPDRDVAVLFVDLNGFKQVNDSYGHETGDKLLIQIARILAGTARGHDLVARLAGDEFVVLLTRIRTDTEAAAAAARYQAALATTVQVGSYRLPVSATVGVARPRPGDTPTTLLRAADQAMYQAKRQRAGTGAPLGDAHPAPGLDPDPDPEPGTGPPWPDSVTSPPAAS